MTALIITLLVLAHVVLCLWILGLSNLARGRKYKSGTGWCFWRWTRTDSEYILRLHIVKTPWFAVCLHWIRKPDAEPWLHDHPVSFLSIVLRGEYAELRCNTSAFDERWHHTRIKVNKWFNFVRATPNDSHRIILCRANTLTLCFMGPKTREWGFHIPAPREGRTCHTWIMWKDYYARLKAGENMRGDFEAEAPTTPYGVK